MIYAYKGSYTATNCYRNIFSNKKKVQHIIENDYKPLYVKILQLTATGNQFKEAQGGKRVRILLG